MVTGAASSLLRPTSIGKTWVSAPCRRSKAVDVTGRRCRNPHHPLTRRRSRMCRIEHGELCMINVR